MNVTIYSVIFLTIVLMLTGGCESGACYYTCCRSNDDCAVGCEQDVPDQNRCTVLAQEKCAEVNGEVKRSDWLVITDLYCSSCNSAACAPEWWTADKYTYDFYDQADDIINNYDTANLRDSASELDPDSSVETD